MRVGLIGSPVKIVQLFDKTTRNLVNIVMDRRLLENNTLWNCGNG